MGLALAFLPNLGLLFTEMGPLLGGASVLLFIARRTAIVWVPDVAVGLWFVGCLWVAFINLFGGWFVSQI